MGKGDFHGTLVTDGKVPPLPENMVEYFEEIIPEECSDKEQLQAAQLALKLRSRRIYDIVFDWERLGKAAAKKLES